MKVEGVDTESGFVRLKNRFDLIVLADRSTVPIFNFRERSPTFRLFQSLFLRKIKGLRLRRRINRCFEMAILDREIIS